MPHIVLVEDNELNSDLISRYLQLFDYQVTVESDGRRGLQRVLRDHDGIDVVLMDMDLPEMDGWELAGRLKGLEATRHLPLIAITAHAMRGDREKAIGAGCDDYVTKPIDFAVLLDKIEQFTKAVAR